MTIARLAPMMSTQQARTKIANSFSAISHLLKTRGSHQLARTVISGARTQPSPCLIAKRFHSTTSHPTVAAYLIHQDDAHVYRGSSRKLTEIKTTGGFHPKNKDPSLKNHIGKKSSSNGDFAPSGYVSTSIEEKVADGFALYNGMGTAYVYRLLRPAIYALSYKIPSDVIGHFNSHATEKELSATDSISDDHIVAYRQASLSEIYQRWHDIREFKLKRDFSIGILSKDDAEAKTIQDALNQKNQKNDEMIYPTYDTACKAISSLNAISALYQSPAYKMTCFEGVNVRVAEQVLDKKPGSGITQNELVTYFVKQYELLQQQEEREKITLPTFKNPR